MAQETETHTTPADRSLGRSILWVALAVFASLYVTAINGGPLFYYDSAGYLDNGFKVMRMLGMLQTETIGGAGAGGGEALGDGAYILSLTGRFAGCRGPRLSCNAVAEEWFSGHGPLCYVRTD